MTALYDLHRGDKFKLLEDPADKGDTDLVYTFTHVAEDHKTWR